jgi:hypothetical protein
MTPDGTKLFVAIRPRLVVFDLTAGEDAEIVAGIQVGIEPVGEGSFEHRGLGRQPHLDSISIVDLETGGSSDPPHR